ncbi:MAG: TraR/DksA C4-type zinc finger protein [Paenibacillaceae bacterium]
MKSLSKSQKNELKQLLLEQQANLTKRLANSNNFGLASSLHESPGELSNYDNHPADNGTELFEQGKDLALNENTEAHLREVNEALAVIDTKNYGFCTHCNQPIPFERLQVIPETRYCIKHSPEQEISHNRPIEEQLLPFPYDSTSPDEYSRQNSFNAEDAWEIVESWGNSDSPAMSEDREMHSYNDLFIEAAETEGFVEAYESFVATDIYGKQVSIVRNKAYREYMANQEGDPLLEPEERE